MIRRNSLAVCLAAVLVFSIVPLVAAVLTGNAGDSSYPKTDVIMAITNSTFSWNPRITCAPLVVRITDITANQTQGASFTASPFSPGITTTVTGGVAKRWLTPGPTPPGWVTPGPPCTVTNSKGTTSLFVQINGVERNDLTNEDWSNIYDPTNGGTVHSDLTSDTTFNLFDPTVVPAYFLSCTASTDPTCYGRIHAEIDHDWKAIGYCGTGTFCDNTTLASQTITASTKIDVQGFVYWDPVNLNATWHQFSGWELHPLTAWKQSSAPPPPPPGTPDFTIATSSSSLSFNSGSTATSTAQLTSVNSFAGTIILSTSASPATGLTVTCSPSSIALSAGGTATSTCTLSSSTPGTYTATLTGVSGSLSHSTTMTVTVTLEKHDFAITATPASLALYPGASGTSTISIIAGTVFHRTVSLTAAASPGLTATINPTSIDTSGTSVLTVSAAVVGNYTVTVTGSTASITHAVTMTVRVIDFTISANPTSLITNAGAQGTSTITITPINGFNGTVALATTASHGLYATLNPTSITGSATSSLTVSALLTGNYTVSVTGTAGSLSHTTPMITVRVVDFTIATSLASVTINAGQSGTTTINVQGINGFTGNVSLSASASAGLTASLSPTTIVGSGTSTLTLTAAVAGNYTVTVTGTSSSLLHTTAEITVRVGDFSISVSPSSETVVQGSTSTFTITSRSLNGFTGTVTLNSLVSRTSAITVTCAASSVVLAPGETATVVCYVTGLSNGNTTITITGTSGPLSHSATISVRVRQHA